MQFKNITEGGQALNLEDHYDRIFKYQYFHPHGRYMAKNLTQEVYRWE